MARTVSTKNSIVPRSKPRAHGARVRYAVVGLGHIAQVAVLPAFGHAASNSHLTALVSDDPKKLESLSRRYKVPYTYSYDEYDKCLREGHVDAVFIALPNSMHCDYAVRALRAGLHVLCEKPMAVTTDECRRMIQAAERSRTKLMIAYRLHFEPANMNAVDLARSDKLGDIRIFNSVFSQQVRAGDIRVRRKMGGGSLYDIGVYCINAARYVFQDNPVEVQAMAIRGTDPRFREVDEMTGGLLRFPDDRLACFVCSFGAADVSFYEVVGTKGRLQVDPAYEYVGELKQQLAVNGKARSRSFKSGDQFAAELIYFSDCIRKNREPEPSGLEGMIDVQVIEALYRSSKQGKAVKLSLPRKTLWPSREHVIRRPPVRKPKVVRAASPTL